MTGYGRLGLSSCTPLVLVLYHMNMSLSTNAARVRAFTPHSIFLYRQVIGKLGARGGALRLLTAELTAPMCSTPWSDYCDTCCKHKARIVLIGTLGIRVHIPTLTRYTYSDSYDPRLCKNEYSGHDTESQRKYYRHCDYSTGVLYRPPHDLAHTVRHQK